MWMMDSSIAYDTKPQSKRTAAVSVSPVERTEIIRTSSHVSDVPEEEKITLKDRLKEKTVQAVTFFQSEETAEKVNSLKEKATSAVNQAGAKTSDIVSGAVSFLQSEETAEKVNSLKEKATSAVNQAGAKTSDIVSDAVSFFKPESSDKKLVIDEEKTQPVFSSPDFHQQNHDETLVRNPQSGVLYAIIGILSLIIIIGGIVLFTYIKKISDSHEVSVSNALAEPGQNQFAENSMEIPVTEASVPVSVASQNTAVLLSSGTGTSNEKVYQDFYQILQSSDFVDVPGGYLYDIDHDGKDDMILKDNDTMDFVLYTHDSSGNLYMTHFGSFLAWGSDDFYDVTGTDNTHYIYYSDEYAQRSIQGYYDPQTGKELDLSDNVSTEEVIKMLSESGFRIAENSSYSKIEMLYYDDLCQKAAPVETVPVTEKRNPPEIKCEIKQKSAYDGSNYMLYVSGNYDYYYVECRQYGYQDTTGTLILSKNARESSLCLTNGYDIASMTASVTPYYEDGTKGETITCSFKQPEQKITSVPKPSDVTAYMGKGTPDEGHLNIRSSRSTSSDIIAKIYVGETMDVYYIDGDDDWRYVEFGSYSGYVMSKYVILTDPEGLWADGKSEYPEVYSCYKTGEINGSNVPGFTTSYIVNLGARSTVRDQLGNRWHVTAYNYCYSYGHTWYELYDTDDGDYYGWVNGDCISFY